MASPRISPGMIVLWTARRGYWEVVHLEEHEDSHSPIAIQGALIRPMGERMTLEERHARIADLALVPPDLEDWPCSFV